MSTIYHTFCDFCKKEIESFRDEAEDGSFTYGNFRIEYKIHGNLCVKCAEKKAQNMFKNECLEFVLMLLNDHRVPLK